MPTVTNDLTGQSAQCQKGDELRMVAQTQGLGIPFGCENGLCGTCLININSGMEHLSEKTEQEEFTLEARSADDDQRLSCQCKVLGDVHFEQ